MRWQPGGPSSDLEDRRGETAGRGGFGFGGTRLGLGGLIVVGLLSIIFRRNFFALFSGDSAPSQSATPQGPTSQTPAEQREVQFVSFVLDDAQNTWSQIFAQRGQQYPHARLVLFRDGIRSGCGFAETQVGPFYCPTDQKVYVDLGFFNELSTRFGAPGEFAQAYVIAHEIGHHVQRLLGIEQRMRQMQQANPSMENALSVRLELQADCFAGVWGHSTAQRNILENGDVEAGLQAAASVGDDTLQRSAGRAVQPERFTHGSSAQRVAWFRRGLQSGSIEACDTFGNGT
jgi:predicted metalloprotease